MTGKPLEARVISEKSDVLGFDLQDQFVLSRGIDKNELATGGDYTVDLVAPWSTVYNISRHYTQVAAQVAFEEYSNKLNSDEYKVRLKSPARAELIEK